MFDVIVGAVFAKLVGDRVVGVFLQIGIERRAYGQHTIIAELAGVGELAHSF